MHNDDLSVLKGSKRVRDKISVMFGSNDKSGVSHGLFEIIANSIDRHKKGFGDVVKVTVHTDNSLEVEDFGDGLPMLWNEKEQAYNWDIALKTLYGGSNYQKSDNNEGVLGTNGLGLTTAQYSSEYMNVTSRRADGNCIKAKFKKGRPVDYNTGEFLVEDNNEFLDKQFGEKVLHIEKNTSGITGTKIKYKPDQEVFIETVIDSAWIKNKLLKQAVINNKLKLIFKDNIANEEIEYLYESPKDYMMELGIEPITEILSFEKDGIGRDGEIFEGKLGEEYKANYKINLFFDNKTGLQEYFHNGSELTELSKNATTRGFEKAILNSINKYMLQEKIIKKNSDKLKFDDIKPSLIALIDTKSTFTSYSNQTKLSISNKFLEELISKDFEEQFTIILTENSELAKCICERVLINKKARESAENTRLNIKKKLESDTNAFIKPEGLIPCKNKIASETELFICEGKSALGSIIKARDSYNQACIPVRGKILNCLKNKNKIERILQSEIVVNIIKALGCGISVNGKHKDLNTFDLEKLKYSKVIIASDADVDGYQIRTLILVMLYVLTPQLLVNGNVFIVEAPLFEITVNGEIHYLYTEQEKEIFVENNKGKKMAIGRNKGLGQMTPEAMSETMMHPDTRRLIQITMDDLKEADKMFELFLGEQIEPRKQFITEHFDEYLMY